MAAAAWGHGFATEAARRVAALSFDDLRLTELYSLTAVSNQPSQAVMRRIGMTEWARADHPRVSATPGLRPHVVFRLTRDDWLRRTRAVLA